MDRLIAPRPVLLRPVLLASVLLAASLAQQARAQSCSASVTDIDFGNPSPLSTTPTDVLATLNVTCTRISFLTVLKMCPDIGEGSAGSTNSARLLRASGGATLTYQLYQDSSRSLGWGAIDEPDLGTVPAILLSGGLSGAATATRTIYARLYGSQTTAPAAVYTSTFSGNENAFTFSSYFLSASSSCTGFVGTSVVRPEFDVIATVLPSCSITTTDLDFGAVGVLRSAVNGQSSVRVACTRQTPFTVSLDGGLASAAPVARKLTSAAGDAVTYGLYRDAARALPWGDTSANRAAGTGSGSEQVYSVYGLVPTQTTPKPSVYSDRIIATVTY